MHHGLSYWRKLVVRHGVLGVVYIFGVGFVVLLRCKVLQGPQCIRMSVGQGSTLFLFIHLPTTEPRGDKKSRTMKKDEKKKEELQSRREFFKKAAKAALPVVGAVVLSSLPIKEAQAQGCYGCGGSCYSSCANSCRGYCSSGCTGSCQMGCKMTCANRCNAGSGMY